MTAIPRHAVTPVGLNHIVLNVRDMDESQAFWTEILFELPRDIWVGDIDAKSNWSVTLPTEGRDAPMDGIEGLPVFT